METVNKIRLAYLIGMGQELRGKLKTPGTVKTLPILEWTIYPLCDGVTMGYFPSQDEAINRFYSVLQTNSKIEKLIGDE